MNTFQTVAQIPGPPLRPVLGWRGFVIDFARDPVAFLTRLHDQYGRIAHMGQGKMSATFTFHPDYTRQVLSNPQLFYSFSLEDIPFPFSDIQALKSMTTAISLLNGEQHKRQRRLMMPAFHNHTLPFYVSDIARSVEKFFGKWKYGQVVDIYPEMDLFTVVLSMEEFVGMQADKEGEQFAHLFEEVLNLLFSPLVFLFPYDFPGLPYHRLRVQGTNLERQLKDLIQRRREKELDGMDSLSMFLKAHDEDGSRMSDAEVIGETVAVFRGGSKTTAGALTWALFLLTQHPKAYSDLMDELTGTLRGTPPTFSQLDQLPLLEGVIKETLRLVPPVLWGIRYGADDFEIAGYYHAKGGSVIYSSHITHRLPEIYTNADRFDPYRWETIRPSPYEYFPFNAGPRRCLGAEFAMMEIKIALAILLQKFRFRLVPNQRIDRAGLVGSYPKYGIKVRLEKPDGPISKVPVRGTVHRLVDLD